MYERKQHAIEIVATFIYIYIYIKEIAAGDGDRGTNKLWRHHFQRLV
jgi:hypothetical protein